MTVDLLATISTVFICEKIHLTHAEAECGRAIRVHKKSEKTCLVIQNNVQNY